MLIPSKEDLRSDGHGDKIRFVSQAEVGNRQKYKYIILYKINGCERKFEKKTRFKWVGARKERERARAKL